MRVLLVEPWMTGSHRQWAEGYAAHSSHEVNIVCHAGSYWRWRLRGSAVTLNEEAERLAAENGPFDIVLASSMTDTAGFIGLSRRWLGATPVVYYAHESQALLASLVGDSIDDGDAYRNWTSMLAADRVVFNSEFHRSAWFDLLPDWLSRAPDRQHTGLIDSVAAKSEVLPVGVDVAGIRSATPTRDHGPPIVVWPHRWDHDKRPDVFFQALRRLVHDGVEFGLALAGVNERVDPQEFTEAIRWFGDRVVHVGELDRNRYVELLGRSSVVVSTAAHEFFGVAVVEAIAAGCTPVLPNRLSYPGIVPPAHHGEVLYDDYRGLVERLRSALSGGGVVFPEAMQRFDWQRVALDYDACLASVVSDVR